MNHGHGAPAGPAGLPVAGWVALAVAAVAVAAHLAAVLRLHGRSVRWPAARTAAGVAGLAVIGAGLAVPPGSFPRHVAAHLLVAMVGPLLLALSAPVTLGLRALPTAARRRAVRVLHSRPVRALAWPWTALVLDTGGTAVLYLGPLWGAAERHPLVHTAVMVHMALAGVLFSVVVLGVDPVPRTRLATRLAVLFVAAGTHDAVTRLMYAHTLPAGMDRSGVRAGAELMSAGGTAVELGLAVAVLGRWYAGSGRELARARRRAGADGKRTPGPVVARS